jgi:hypothetical protein
MNKRSTTPTPNDTDPPGDAPDGEATGERAVMDLSDFERVEEERAFMRAVVEGLADLEEGREVSLAEARARVSR